jgi:hypothetical protein
MESVNRSREILYWTILLAFVAFIYATLNVIPIWREALVKKFGETVFATITYGAAGFFSALILYIMIVRNREKKILPYVAVFLVLFALRYVMVHWITIPVEQIHFIEYALVGFLAYNALRLRLNGWGLIAASLLLTYFFGMVDECIQGNLADRVGEQRDMYWNGLAGTMGVTVVAAGVKLKGISRSYRRRSYGIPLLILLFCLPLQGYFNSAIAQFGYRIEDEVRGVVFRSRLRPAELKRYNVNIEYFKREVAPKIGTARIGELQALITDKIHEEALVHAFRRAVYYRNGHFPIAYKENLILDCYFRNFISGTQLQWDDEIVGNLRNAIGNLANATYESPVAGHLITKFTAMQMWMIIIICEIIIVFFMRRLRRIKE